MVTHTRPAYDSDAISSKGIAIIPFQCFFQGKDYGVIVN